MLRLSAEVECDPLWRWDAEGELENLPTASFGLPAEVADAVERWSAAFQQTYDPDDPVSSGFSTEREQDLFQGWGDALALLVAEALGGPVERFDRVLRRYRPVLPLVR